MFHREVKTLSGHVEMKMELEKLRNSLKSERRRRTLQKAEHLIDAARQAQHALEEMNLLVKDFMPNVGKCVLQNYARVNNAPIMAQDVLAKLRALFGETGTITEAESTSVNTEQSNTALIEALQAAHLALHLKSESRQRWTTHDQRAYEKVRDALMSVGAVRPISTLLGDRAQHDPSHAPRNDT